VDNASIHVRECYEPIARRLLECQARKLGEVRLIVDGSKVGFKHRLLMVGLAYRRDTALLTSKGRFWATSGVSYPMEQRGFRWSATANSERLR
jgi:hypothetical protein